MCKNMRINTSGKKAFRNDLYERTAETLDENTKTGAIDAACIHANQDIKAKAEAIDYLSNRMSPKELQEIAGILSTDEVEITVNIETEVVPSL